MSVPTKGKKFLVGHELVEQDILFSSPTRCYVLFHLKGIIISFLAQQNLLFSSVSPLSGIF